MRKLLLVLSSLTLMVSCGHAGDDTIDIVYDPCQPLVVAAADDASEAEIRSIDEAIALWNERAGTALTREPVEGADVIYVLFEPAAPMFYGLYRDEIGDVVVNRELSDHQDRTITVTHELGHAFGLNHVDDRASVMNMGNLEVTPTNEDVEDVWNQWPGCLEAAPVLP